jgi:glycosyltransferase involved in cell wall biosynthesis
MFIPGLSIYRARSCGDGVFPRANVECRKPNGYDPGIMSARPVTFLITDLHRGGSPLLLAELVTRLQSRGWFAPHVVSIAPFGEVADMLQSANVPVTTLGARHSRDLRVLPRFITHLRAHRPELVCSILIHANILATLAKPFVPPMKWIQCLHTLQERPRWHWYAQGVIASAADAFVAPARAVVTRLSAFGAIPRPTVIPNGIDVPRFRDAVPMHPVPWLDDAQVIGYVGRFDRVKRLPLLLRAFSLMIQRDPARWSNVHLALVGDGPEREALGRLNQRLGRGSASQSPSDSVSIRAAPPNRVHFLGLSPTPERWLKRFDVFCSPSSAEGFGLTLVEAAAAGLPVIACDTPAIRESLPEALWLSAEPSIEELAQLLCKGLFEHHTRAVPSADFVGRYALGSMVEGYESVFDSLLS